MSGGGDQPRSNGKFVARPLEDRFWSKVDTSAGPDGCWLWLASTTSKGYGIMGLGRKCALAHRVSYSLLVADPGRLFVCHSCDNPPCVNPSHLFLGTNDDNVADRDAKGRTSRVPGSANGRAKVTEHDVVVMRRMAGAGASYKSIAEQYGVTPSTAHRICVGGSWRHVPMLAALDQNPGDPDA